MCHFHNSGPRFRPFGGRGFQPGAAGFTPFSRFSGHSPAVPVNIRETKDWYEIFVYAPGLSKDAFGISVSGDVLTVKAQGSEKNQQGNWFHNEYTEGGFERQFLLHGKVDTDAITARYTDGVLELTLPKLPGTEGKDITIQ